MKKDRFRVSVFQDNEVITISVEDVISKLKQVKTYSKVSLISIDINFNIFISSEIKKLKNKLKRIVT